MKLTEVISISGQPGLFKFVAQSKSGFIVESLIDNRRFPVSSTARVSTLADISIFTVAEDMALAEVMQLMYEKNEGKVIDDVKKMSNDDLKATMKRLVDSYDEDRVRVSDMKKLFSWFNILVAAGATSFVEKAEEAGEESQNTEAAAEKSVAEVIKPKAAPKAKAAAPKAPKAASKSKATSKVRTIKAS